jgi:hypothetical protein
MMLTGVDLPGGDDVGALVGPIVGAVVKIGSIVVKKAIVSGAAVPASRIIGLGLEADYHLLRSGGATVWQNGGWQRIGVSNVPQLVAEAKPAAFWKSFTQAAENADAIRFELTSYKFDWARPGVTSRELSYILSNPSLLSKTSFIRNGSQVLYSDGRFFF